jgi:hypothetical protein
MKIVLLAPQGAAWPHTPHLIALMPERSIAGERNRALPEKAVASGRSSLRRMRRFRQAGKASGGASRYRASSG